MHRLTVQPTWRTAVVRKRLKGSSNDFQVRLMDGMFNERRAARLVFGFFL